MNFLFTSYHASIWKPRKTILWAVKKHSLISTCTCCTNASEWYFGRPAGRWQVIFVSYARTYGIVMISEISKLQCWIKHRILDFRTCYWNTVTNEIYVDFLLHRRRERDEADNIRVILVQDGLNASHTYCDEGFVLYNGGWSDEGICLFEVYLLSTILLFLLQFYLICQSRDKLCWKDEVLSGNNVCTDTGVTFERICLTLTEKAVSLIKVLLAQIRRLRWTRQSIRLFRLPGTLIQCVLIGVVRQCSNGLGRAAIRTFEYVNDV